MKRRDFIRIGLFTIPVIYGFPGRLFSFKGKDALASSDPDIEHYNFSGSYSGEIMDDMILMPEEFMFSLRKYEFHVVAPEDNGFVILIPEDTPQMKVFKKIKNSRLFKKKTPFLHEANVEITDNGSLLIPREMQEFAGIRSGKVTIVGQQSMIEIRDTRSFAAS
ncbi:MAG: hypothetical protein U9Q38_05445 [Thermodesulfobacteriota bacterium]|nr:hypothetical protein [Thermodesulfobacteriota bacterium]